MTKAYSYLRFSHPEQVMGDSLRRQNELAINYAEQNGLKLDTSFDYTDRGISAFRGLNAQIGALKQFLDHIETGLIEKGSYLLVESLDRISRDEITSALSIFLQIIQSGVTIVTLFDKRKYNKEIVNANPTELLTSLLFMMRAREESTTKSKRIKAAWHSRRLNIGNKILTHRGRIWTKYNKKLKEFKLIPKKAKIIKDIFNMALKGKSTLNIARTLNSQRVPRLGISKFWTHQQIYYLLHDPAVTGTLILREQKHIDGKLKLEPMMRVEKYYPEVISQKLFNKVNEIRPRHKIDGAKWDIRNIFGYMAKCPRCYSTMSKIKIFPNYFLICSRAMNRSGCKAKYVRYAELEEAFLNNIDEIVSAAPDSDSTIKMKFNHIKQIVSTEPLERAKLNFLLRQLFEKVLIDYRTSSLVLEWKSGENTIVKYAD